MQLRHALERRGHAVTAVGDAEAAWACCQRAAFPLIVLDWVLPGADGLELCRRIRALPWGEGCVILLTTVREGPDDLERALSAGVSDYLPKSAGAGALTVRLAVAERQVADLARRRTAEEALADHADRRTRLIAVQQEIMGAWHDPLRLLELIALRALELTGAAGALLALLDASTLVGRAAAGTATPQMGLRQDLDGAGLESLCARTGQPLRCDDAPRDPRASGGLATHLGWHSLLCVPLLWHGQTFGVLTAGTPLPGSLTDQDADLLQLLGGICAAALTYGGEHEALRASEGRFRALSAHASDLVIVMRADGTLRYVSPSHQRILGYAPESLEGRSALEIVHPEDQQRLLATLAEARPGHIGQAEARLRHADGTWRTVEALGSNHLDDPAIGGFVINSRDITARRAAETALAESEARLRLILEQLPSGVLIVDAARRVQLVNGTMHRIMGAQPQDYPGGTGGFALRDPESDLPVALERTPLSLALVGEAVRAVTFVHRHPGEAADRWCQSSAVPIRDSSGAIIGAVAVFVDVTRERQLVQDALVATERLRTVTANAPIILFALDAEGVFTLAEGRGLAALALAPEALIGWSVFDLYAGEPPILDAFRRALAGEPLTFEQEIGGLVFENHLLPTVDAVGRLTSLIGVGTDITARVHAEQVLRQSEERFRLLVERAPISIGIATPDGIIESTNAAYCAMVGYTEQELVGQHVRMLLAPEQASAFARRAVANAEGQREWELLTKDGGRLTVLGVGLSIPGPDGHLLRASFLVDITERSRAEEAVRRSEARLALQYAATRILADAASLASGLPTLLRTVCEGLGWRAAGFWALDEGGASLRLAEGWHDPEMDDAFATASRALAFARGEGLPGRVWQSQAPLWVPEVAAEPGFLRGPAAARAGLHGAVFLPVCLGPAFHGVLEFFAAAPVAPDDDLLVALTTVGVQLGQFLERLRAEEALRHQALHDALTGLPNRALLHDRAAQALAASARDGGGVALLLMDLDGFKAVNDTLGHEVGDLLLRQVAARVQATLRASDTVARLGGDEFAVLLPGADLLGATIAARAIQAAIARPILVHGHLLNVGASIGAALAPVHGADASTLLRKADVAMYAAKRGGGGSTIYDAELDAQSASRQQLAEELRLAIDGGELLLHYQPQIELESGRAVGMEALLRWAHPRHGLLPPDRFLPVAEEPSLVAALFRWVLETALAQQQVWRQAGYHLHLAINVAPLALFDPQLPDTLAWLLHAHDALASSLHLEVGEGAIMADPARAQEALAALAAVGVHLALDDVGADSSLLSLLRRLPLDTIKLDTTLIGQLATDQDAAAIVRAALALGQHLGLTVVAEGVERAETLAALAALGCARAQGYGLCRPQSAPAMTTWLREQAPPDPG